MQVKVRVFIDDPLDKDSIEKIMNRIISQRRNWQGKVAQVNSIKVTRRMRSKGTKIVLIDYNIVCPDDIDYVIGEVIKDMKQPRSPESGVA